MCWLQIEIDRINVRPDGLEVVIEDDVDLDVGSQDPQASFVLFGAVVRGFSCSQERPGIPPPGGYLAFDAPADDVPRGDFSFGISRTTGSVGGATIPTPTDGP